MQPFFEPTGKIRLELGINGKGNGAAYLWLAPEPLLEHFSLCISELHGSAGKTPERLVIERFDSGLPDKVPASERRALFEVFCGRESHIPEKRGKCSRLGI